MALRIFRVLVGGRFGPLDPDVRARLLADVGAHGAASAGFSEAGTLTYDRMLDAFGFRQQVRVQAEDHEADDEDTTVEARAVAQAERSAVAALAAIGVTAAPDLRSTATDMASVWQRTGGTGRSPRP